MKKASTITLLMVFISNIAFSQFGGGTNQDRKNLKQKLAIAKNDTSRVLIMSEISGAYWTNNFDSLTWYGNQALALAQRIQFFRGEVSALIALGAGLQCIGDYPKSIEYLYRGLQIAEKKNYIFEKAYCYLWIGVAYWYLEDYSQSVDFYIKSKSLFNTIVGNPAVKPSITFVDMGIGQTYVDWNRLDSAYHYLSQYYETTLKNTFWHPVALYLLGDCLFKSGDHETGFKYVRESIVGAILNSDFVTQSEAYAVISRFFKTIQEPDSAIYYAKKGVATGDSMVYNAGLYKNSKLLALEYEPLNAREALYYRKIYDSVNEQIYGAEKFQDLHKTLTKEQQRQQQLQQTQIENENRLKQYGFIAGLAIALSIAFIFYRNNLQKKKTNALLLDQKEKVEDALQELKSTQAQLIQQEKMASLGEMTAGIAHEIQNPLNFVNNFSEVNAELTAELKEQIQKQNYLEANRIAGEIESNEQKIIHHGKRADSIVKNMLLHSRAGSGQKELIDISSMADEYLRLTFHGLRAKDKTFNAAIKTDFDNNIGKTSVIPQDIGRVLLNLYSNAFYAVTEKKKHLSDHYEPLVIVSTKKLKDKVEIRVKDNGTGIPKKIQEKIFQPFFTTKPAGEGTGLGLSLTYDIIKAHGGDIKVETKEGEGTEFIIQLPN